MNRYQLIAALSLGLSAATNAHSADTPPCPFSPEYLSAQLGQPFKAGVQENGIVGKACRYDGTSVKVWIDAGPLPAPTAASWRKMASPAGTAWKELPGDPDRAVHEIPGPGVTPYPALSYERKDWLVNITVTGISDKANIEKWNAKLVKLLRIP